MRSRTLGRAGQVGARGAPHLRAPRSGPPPALHFLRGRDADGRLRELTAERARVRPILGELAAELVRRRGFERLGFRSLGDWSRERIGVGARAVREWARVWRMLVDAPQLRRAVLSGEVSWTVARRIASVVTSANEGACLEAVRNRTVRAVEALLRAAAPEAPPPSGEAEARVSVRLRCSSRVATKWSAALELARRVAGEALPVWECAEAIAAECASAWGPAEPKAPARETAFRVPAAHPTATEPGLRSMVWPRLAWRGRDPERSDSLQRLTTDVTRCPPRELDQRMRAAIAFLQRVDFEIARVLRQVVDRKLHRELGFETFERYVVERLDLSPRTARRLVRLARAEMTRPAVARAFRAGRITLLQAELLLRGGSVALAESVTLRRLEDEVPEGAVAFSAPPDVARLFQPLVACFGLEAMLDHAIAAWLQAGSAFRDYADFERDGWRCTVPACSARRNLQSHHIRFRSAGGPDVPWNRTTLCAFHHHRGVHAGAVRVQGRAPDELRFQLVELGGRFGSGDVKLAGHAL